MKNLFGLGVGACYALPSRVSDAGPEQSAPMDTMDLLFEAGDSIRYANRAEDRKARMVAISQAIEYLQRALNRDMEGRPYVEN